MTSQRRLGDVLVVTLCAAFAVIGIMIAMGPGGLSPVDDGDPGPDPAISTKAPASVTVDR